MSKRDALLKKLRAWEKQPRDRFGRFAKKAANNPKVRDALVNAGGVVGSIAGAHVAGPAGALIGDAVGAAAARGAIAATETALSTSDKAKRVKRLQKYSRMQKLKGLTEIALREYEGKAEKLKDDLTEDMLGWLIGNASAIGLSAAVPGLANVPLKGTVPAMLTVPKISKAIKNRRKAKS